MTTAVEQHGEERRTARDELLSAQGLSFTTDTRTLWRNLTVVLRPGERLAIAGASGNGKTLLLRTLAGLEPLERGEIRYRGRPMIEWFMPEYRSRVVYVPQNPRLREGAVRQALEAPFRLRVRRGRPFPVQTARAHLASVGRTEAFLAQRTEQLSGGEAQIVAVLRALVTEPEILLLDEPTASLDAAAALAVESLVTRWLAADPSRAWIWTSHDKSQLARVSDRAIELEPAA